MCCTGLAKELSHVEIVAHQQALVDVAPPEDPMRRGTAIFIGDGCGWVQSQSAWRYWMKIVLKGSQSSDSSKSAVKLAVKGTRNASTDRKLGPAHP